MHYLNVVGRFVRSNHLQSYCYWGRRLQIKRAKGVGLTKRSSCSSKSVVQLRLTASHRKRAYATKSNHVTRIAEQTSVVKMDHSAIYGHCILKGRTTAQAVSRGLPTAAARVRAQVRQSGNGAGFLRVLRFPLPILIPPTAPHYHLSSETGTIGQLVADVPSGLSLTPPQETKKKKNEYILRQYYLNKSFSSRLFH
jgi:hypothetical protein